jgi:hypothetical protein
MNKLILSIIVLLSLSTAGLTRSTNQDVEDLIFIAHDDSLELSEEAADSFCRKPKNFLGDIFSTISKGVVDVSSKLFDTAKRVAPHLKNGIGTIAYLADAGLDKIDPEALAKVLKVASDTILFSAPVLGALIGVEIPTSALDKISTYATPANVTLAVAMAKGLTGASKAVFYTDPNAEKTTVETAGEVVKSASGTVAALIKYLQDNEGKISKNEENEVKAAIQEGIKLMTEIR